MKISLDIRLFHPSKRLEGTGALYRIGYLTQNYHLYYDSYLSHLGVTIKLQ